VNRIAARENATPAQLGYRMPAEWEPHEATWLAWPHNPTDWPGKLPAIQWVYGEIVRKLVPGERVRILVNSAKHEAQARHVLKRAGADSRRVEFFRWPTNRGWTRDFGPICVKRNASPSGRRSGRTGQGRQGARAARVAVVRFAFRGWAKYPDWRKDDTIAELSARQLKLPLFRATVDGRPFVLEGGAIDVNGRGTLLTTEECLLDAKTQVRNPGLARAGYEAALRKWLGVTNVLWLGRGIAGDDTHGHVDDLCRFVGPRRAVLCQETNPRDANYRALEENRERLEGMRMEDGSKMEVIPLPMPAPLFFDGQRLPASYANFYIANSAVLVPTFNDPKDRVALAVLADCFPDRAVVGIHAVDLVWGLGTLHCLTQQQPIG
jgi:agmatine deiminase